MNRIKGWRQSIKPLLSPDHKSVNGFSSRGNSDTREKVGPFFVTSSTAKQTHVENFILMKADVTKEEKRPITWAWKPGFKIKFLGRSVVQRSRDDVNDPVGDVEGLVESLGVANHLVHHLPRQVVVRGCDAKLFHLQIEKFVNNLHDKAWEYKSSKEKPFGIDGRGRCRGYRGRENRLPDGSRTKVRHSVWVIPSPWSTRRDGKRRWAARR